MSQTLEVSVDQIRPSPYQPRLTFDLEDLKGSILKDGILVPLTVRRKDGYYELIDGERRLRLAKELSYETVPVTVIDVSDEVARRMVWKVNTLRKDYTPKEKAYHFKKLQEAGLSLRAIGRECDYDVMAVRAYLNVLKLPQNYQELVWNDGRLSVSHIQELDTFFNGVVRTTDITDKLDLVLDRKLTRDELRQTIRPELEEVERKRVEAAQKAASEVEPEVSEPQTPEDYEKAAQVLKKKAKELKSPAEKYKEIYGKAHSSLEGVWKKLQKADKTGVDISDFQQRYDNAVLKLEPIPEKSTIQEAKEVWEEAKQLKREIDKAVKKEKKRQEEEERRKREEEIRRKASEEATLKAEKEARNKLLENRDFLEEATSKLQQLEGNIVGEPSIDDRDLPVATDQPQTIERFLSNYAEALKKVPDRPIDKIQATTSFFKRFLENEHVSCPICGESKLQWRCGHEF